MTAGFIKTFECIEQGSGMNTWYIMGHVQPTLFNKVFFVILLIISFIIGGIVSLFYTIPWYIRNILPSK